jgi:hypothetical protein
VGSPFRVAPNAEPAGTCPPPSNGACQAGGGQHETFTVAQINPPRALVYRSRRGRIDLTWSITLRADNLGTDNRPRTRVLLRLRLAHARRPWVANTAGELIDLLTIAAMAAGLHERLTEREASRSSTASPPDP